MSMIDRNEEKVVLPRSGADEFWRLIEEHFAGDDQRKWKYLAMLVLHEIAGWPMERIGQAFGHPRGHVARCIDQMKRSLRNRFDQSLEPDSCDDNPHGGGLDDTSPVRDSSPAGPASPRPHCQGGEPDWS